jgi:uncharacterized protein
VPDNILTGAVLPDGILNETIASVTEILRPDLDSIKVERAVIGLFFTGVKLTTGTAGTCATPRDAVPGDICCPISAHRVAFQRIAGRPAAELMQGALAENGLTCAIGIATLNALAELCWRRRPHPGVESCRTPMHSTRPNCTRETASFWLAPSFHF